MEATLREIANGNEDSVKSALKAFVDTVSTGALQVIKMQL